ncbi:hypothetical protein B0H14DRAFT_3713240 [Mycena olivaceomarginata]|nr:hypothetical protein B0H14DRAFT_3713240 [Mycena olivaceomarginata]
MRLHARIDARKHLHSILVAPSGTSSGPSDNDQSASPDQQLEPVSGAESQSDNGDDYLIFEPNSETSGDANHATSEYLWPASDNDSASCETLGFSTDSDENSDSPEVADESSEDEEIVVDEPRDEDVNDIASDPLFCTRASLFDAFQQGQENPADESIVPSAFPDPNKPMTDITDGWGWRAIQAELEQRRNGVWEVRDVDVLELKQQFVALPNGIVIQINIDW